MTATSDRPPVNPCAHCAASLPSCNAKRMLSGRHCCEDCSTSHAHAHRKARTS